MERGRIESIANSHLLRHGRFWFCIVILSTILATGAFLSSYLPTGPISLLAHVVSRPPL
jgi:hypothetical protein